MQKKFAKNDKNYVKKKIQNYQKIELNYSPVNRYDTLTTLKMDRLGANTNLH